MLGTKNQFLGEIKMNHFEAKYPQARPANKAYSHGFTLLELLVVMVIIGLLVGYVAPKYFAQVGKSEVKVAKAQIESLTKALDMYRLDVGHYPAADIGLEALVVKPSSEARWGGPYLSKGVPLDPWGAAYQYRIPGVAGDEYDIITYGKDGKAGGVGEDADLNNH